MFVQRPFHLVEVEVVGVVDLLRLRDEVPLKFLDRAFQRSDRLLDPHVPDGADGGAGEQVVLYLLVGALEEEPLRPEARGGARGDDVEQEGRPSLQALRVEAQGMADASRASKLPSTLKAKGNVLPRRAWRQAVGPWERGPGPWVRLRRVWFV